MRRFLARLSESNASNHTPSLADFTITTPELKFSVHTTLLSHHGVRPANRKSSSCRGHAGASFPKTTLRISRTLYSIPNSSVRRFPSGFFLTSRLSQSDATAWLRLGKPQQLDAVIAQLDIDGDFRLATPSSVATCRKRRSPPTASQGLRQRHRCDSCRRGASEAASRQYLLGAPGR